MIRETTRSTRTETLFPDTTLFRSPASQAVGRIHRSALQARSRKRHAIHRRVLRAAQLGQPPAPLPEPAPGIPTTRLAVGDQLGAGSAGRVDQASRSEEHTSELQSLMRISYAVFCLKKKR